MSENNNDNARAWAEANGRFLEAAVGWVRLKLEALAWKDAPLDQPAEAPEEPQRRSSGFWRGLTGTGSSGSSTPARPPSSRPAVAPPPDAAEVDAAMAAMHQSASGEHKPAFGILVQRFGLSPFEANLLLLCIAQELDTRVASLCARIHGDPQQAYPTFDLAMALFGGAAWDCRSPERPLRYWRLIEVRQASGGTLGRSALRADDRLVDFVKGLNYLDDRLVPLLAPAHDAEQSAELSASQRQTADGVARTLRGFAPGPRLPVVQLCGSDRTCQRLTAVYAARALGLELLRASAESIPSQASELENFSRLWHREALLLPLALLIETGDAEADHGALTRFLARSEGIVFIAVREPLQRLDRPNLIVETRRPTAAEQKACWNNAVGDAFAVDLERLAAQFDLNTAAISQAAVMALSAGPETPLDKRLWTACRTATQPRMQSMAQRIDAKATWDDIVLPAEATALLRHLCDQVRHRGQVYDSWGFRSRMNRGLGISALFTGESGSGKTMAAEVIANDLQLDLYRIDLSAVVSKYIGETEKNLRRVFDAAEDGGAILFFDEADALFGKRSEVKDSHDRYANIEINYLLQRMEAYRGLAILATNLKQALDHAFLRRLRFVIAFPFPGIAERKQIWQRAFPAPAVSDSVDFDRLARLNLTGGSIHNTALNAAFLAARNNRTIGMQDILDAVRIEMRKLDQPVNETELAVSRPKVVAR